MELIVITQPEYWENEHEVIKEFFKQGLKVLHLRKPDYSTDQMEEFIKLIPERYRNRVVLHSHHELAVEYKLKGIHITEAHRKEGWKLKLKLLYYKIFNANLQLSTSYHTLHQLKRKSRNYAYVFFSPVFESISKKNHKSDYSLPKIQEAVEKCPYKVIALGGIEQDKISIAKDMGFYGVAVMGGLWDTHKPQEKLKLFLELCTPHL